MFDERMIHILESIHVPNTYWEKRSVEYQYWFRSLLQKIDSSIIFDGFPRTVAQAEALELLLERRNMKAVLLDMFVEEDEVIKRLLNRGKTSGRADDNYETIKKRLQEYQAETKPVCTYYLHRHNYFAINGNYSMEDTFSQIDNILKLIQK